MPWAKTPTTGQAGRLRYVTTGDVEFTVIQNGGSATCTAACRNPGGAFDYGDIGADEFPVSDDGGGGGNGDDDDCSTNESTFSWLMLAGLLSALVLFTRQRRGNT